MGHMHSVFRWEIQNHMPLKNVLTRTENKEQPQGRRLHHLTFDMKGIILLALSVLSGIILCYKIVSMVVLDAILTLHFLVIKTVFLHQLKHA